MTKIEYFYNKLKSFPSEINKVISIEEMYCIINTIEAYETNFYKEKENQYIGDQAVPLMLDHIFQILATIDKNKLIITPENFMLCIQGALSIAIKFNYGHDHRFKIDNNATMYYCGIPKSKLKEFNNWERYVLIAIDHVVPKADVLQFSPREPLSKISLDHKQMGNYLSKAEKMYGHYQRKATLFGIGAAEKAKNIKAAILNVKNAIASGKTFDSIDSLAYFKTGENMSIHGALNSSRVFSIKSDAGDKLLKDVSSFRVLK